MFNGLPSFFQDSSLKYCHTLSPVLLKSIVDIELCNVHSNPIHVSVQKLNPKMKKVNFNKRLNFDFSSSKYFKPLGFSFSLISNFNWPFYLYFQNSVKSLSPRELQN